MFATDIRHVAEGEHVTSETLVRKRLLYWMLSLSQITCLEEDRCHVCEDTWQFRKRPAGQGNEALSQQTRWNRGRWVRGHDGRRPSGPSQAFRWLQPWPSAGRQLQERPLEPEPPAKQFPDSWPHECTWDGKCRLFFFFFKLLDVEPFIMQ